MSVVAVTVLPNTLVVACAMQAHDPKVDTAIEDADYLLVGGFQSATLYLWKLIPDDQFHWADRRATCVK